MLAPTAAASAAPAATGRPARVWRTTRAEVARSWRPGCPVHYRDLRTVEVDHLGFDGRVHRGRIVVHRSIVDATVAAFAVALRTGFPVRRLTPVDAYGADDDRSMRADNTSAFNCRRVTNGRGWSRHAYGVAIDINPVENPYVYRRTGAVSPPAGRAFLDRLRVRPGMLVRSTPFLRAFLDRGFRWLEGFDYQHVDRRP